MLSRGYSVSINDSSLFYKKDDHLVVFIAVYVDDILLVGNNTTEIASIKSYLDTVFKIKNLCSLHHFLGLEFNTVPNGMFVSQRKFTLDLLAEFNCLDVPSVISPLDLTVKLFPDQGELYQDASQY